MLITFWVLCKVQCKGKKKDSTSADLKLPAEEESMKYKGKTITRRTDGRWWVRYRHDNKVYAVYARTQKECLVKLKQALKSPPTQSITKKITLKDWVAEWLELYKVGKIKDSTMYDYDLLLRRLAPIEHTQLKDIPAYSYKGSSTMYLVNG